jgi:hypothetical protein
VPSCRRKLRTVAITTGELDALSGNRRARKRYFKAGKGRAERRQGVLFAFGDWSSGIAAFVDGEVLSAALALPGDTLVLQAPERLPSGPARLGCQLRPEQAGGAHLDLVINDRIVATKHTAIALPVAWQHGGTSITLGHDRGLPGADVYTPPFPWNGTLHSVDIDAGQYQPPPRLRAYRP